MSNLNDIVNIDSPEIRLSLLFSSQYERDGKGWMGAFLNCFSIRNICRMIVSAYKARKLFDDCVTACEGRDFTDYVSRLKIKDEWKPVLADTLIIIYSIVKK